MAYTINLTNQSIFATIPDGTRDTSSSLVIIGKNYTGYGEFIGENFVRVLENGANSVAPESPLTGQLWYDTVESKLKVYDSTTFKTLGTTISSTTEPPKKVDGDMWYDTTDSQVKVYNGTTLKYDLVGPLYTSTNGKTGPVVETLLDTAFGEHVATLNYVSGEVVSIEHKDAPFTLNASTPIAGFGGLIYPGVHLATDVSGEVPQYTGTATNSILLNNIPSSGFLSSLNNDTTNGTLGILNDTGLTVGVDSDFRLRINASGDAVMTNATNNGKIYIQASPDGPAVNVISIISTGIGEARARVSDPLSGTDIANKQWVQAEDTALAATKLSLDGSLAMSGALDMGGFKVTNSALATAGTDLLNQNSGDARYVTTDSSSVVNNSGGTVLRVANEASQEGTYAGPAPLEVYQSTSGKDAFMTFHVGGDYAVQFGLDGSTNDLFVGGWSMGTNQYKVWHEGNDGPSSGLYAQTASYASTAGGYNSDRIKFPRDVTGQRAYGTQYYNNSAFSKYIMVRGRNFNNWRGYVSCYIYRSGYGSVTSALMSYTGNADLETGGFWVIPPYSYYRVRSEYPVGTAWPPLNHYHVQWVEWY